MKTIRAASAIAFLLALSGCEASDRTSAAGGGTGGDPRFRLELRTRGTPEAGALEVEITPRGEWHLALDAPARVRFRSAGEDNCSPSPPEIERAQASEASEGRLSFQAQWTGSGRCEAVEGALKFGLCYRDSTQCSIVRERFVLEPCAKGLCPSAS